MTLDLHAFLTARWDEGEALQRDPEMCWHESSCYTLYNETASHLSCDCQASAWVLADIDAKRKILADGPTPCVNGCDEDGHYAGTGDIDPNLTGMTCRECVWAAAETTQWEHTVCLLALPYAAHPDYRKEWAP